VLQGFFLTVECAREPVSAREYSCFFFGREYRVFDCALLACYSVYEIKQSQATIG
jgi:hypothetical protein